MKIALALLHGLNQLKQGIDNLLKQGKGLPNWYFTKKEAKKLGWKPASMNLRQVTNEGVI